MNVRTVSTLWFLGGGGLTNVLVIVQAALPSQETDVPLCGLCLTLNTRNNA